MEALLVSAGVVALAELADKTQLLTLVLAARYNRPWAISAGILAASLLSHGMAGAVGLWITLTVPPDLLRWLVGGAFLAMALWVLVPEKQDGDRIPLAGFGVFAATAGAFFLAELGDKTQLATVALTAHFGIFLAVVLGATIGMLAANLPLVWLGGRIAHRLPVRKVQLVAAATLAVLGILAVSGVAERWGL